MMLVPNGRSLDQAFPPPIEEVAPARPAEGGARRRARAPVHPRARPRARRHQAVEHPRLGRRPRVPDRLRLRQAARRARPPRSGRRARERLPRARSAREPSPRTTGPTSTRSGRRSTRCSAGAPPRKESPIALEHLCALVPQTVCALIHRCLEVRGGRPGSRTPRDWPTTSADVIAGLAAPAPGRTLGPFKILAEIGRGGMGVVFRAVQDPLGREVALKVLPPEFSASPSRVRRFQREAEAVSKLDHPHIIPIYAFGKFGGYHYYAMKLIRGGTLAKTRRHDAAGAPRPRRLRSRPSRSSSQESGKPGPPPAGPRPARLQPARGPRRPRPRPRRAHPRASRSRSRTRSRTLTISRSSTGT